MLFTDGMRALQSLSDRLPARLLDLGPIGARVLKMTDEGRSRGDGEAALRAGDRLYEATGTGEVFASWPRDVTPPAVPRSSIGPTRR